jgi:hypothetical protein
MPRLGQYKIAIKKYVATLSIQFRFYGVGTPGPAVVCVALFIRSVWDSPFYSGDRRWHLYNAYTLPALQKSILLCPRLGKSHQTDLSYTKDMPELRRRFERAYALTKARIMRAHPDTTPD